MAALAMVLAVVGSGGVAIADTPPATCPSELPASVVQELGGQYFMPLDRQHTYIAVCHEEREGGANYKKLLRWTGEFNNIWVQRQHWVMFHDGSQYHMDGGHPFSIYARPNGRDGADKPSTKARTPQEVMKVLRATHYLPAYGQPVTAYKYRGVCLTDRQDGQPLLLGDWQGFEEAYRAVGAHRGNRERRDHACGLLAAPVPANP
jgi:hypothetical protein